MEKLHEDIIEDFGNGYVKFGHSELMGRVVGLLLCMRETVTEDQICEMLHVSKTPVNQITKRLENLNLIRRVWVRGDRKHYYQIAGDVFQQASLNLMRLYEDNLRVAERHLRGVLKQLAQASTEEEKAGLRLVGGRMIAMRGFYQHLLETYQRFIEDWKAAKKNLPKIEDLEKGIEST
jgi:DNA-binding transcriptional regulator GbsR (MarR family)